MVALQVLYEVDCTEHTVAQVLSERAESMGLSPELITFAQHLIEGPLAYRPAIDQMIHRYAPEWPFDQMAIVDRNILRLAIWEFAVDTETPIKVAINEAVELAKAFGADSSPSFINGVLGTLAAREVEIREFLSRYRPSPAPRFSFSHG